VQAGPLVAVAEVGDAKVPDREVLYTEKKKGKGEISNVGDAR